MINTSVGMYHYHTLDSAIIITQHIKMDYTQCSARPRLLMLSNDN